MDDMLMSANEAILSTKTSVDGFGLGVTNLIASVGILGFIGILASLFFFGAGVGGLSLTGAARIDEFFVQPILARIRESSWDDIGDNTLNARHHRSVVSLLSIIGEAYKLYHQDL